MITDERLDELERLANMDVDGYGNNAALRELLRIAALELVAEVRRLREENRELSESYHRCVYLDGKCDNVDKLLAENKELKDEVTHWKEECEKLFPCVECGALPNPNSDLYTFVCQSCHRCNSCAEPSCPTCGDKDGMRLRQIALLKENDRLREALRKIVETECDNDDYTHSFWTTAKSALTEVTK